MSFCSDPAEAPLRTVLTTCADCETCRFLMDESCLLFPKLYWLDDQAQQHRRPVSDDELNQLADLCTLCGLCPCSDIRAHVIRGKARWVAEHGLPLALPEVKTFKKLVSTIKASLVALYKKLSKSSESLNKDGSVRKNSARQSILAQIEKRSQRSKR